MGDKSIGQVGVTGWWLLWLHHFVSSVLVGPCRNQNISVRHTSRKELDADRPITCLLLGSQDWKVEQPIECLGSWQL